MGLTNVYLTALLSSMYIKINTPRNNIFLCDDTDFNFISPSPGSYLHVPVSSMEDLKKHQNDFVGLSTDIIFKHENLNWLQQTFFSLYENITAAGGLVINPEGKMLFIFRRGKWDLPKGKLDPGESIETCAAREIMEETGVSPLVQQHKITDSFHLYTQHNITFLKTTHWYHFTTTFNGNLVPQTEEDITGICWLGKEELNQVLSNTYEAIKDLLRAEKIIS